MIRILMLDQWLKLFPPIFPLVLPSMWLRACACAVVKMYLSLYHTHTHLHSLFEFPDVGYVIFILFHRQSYTRCLLSNIKGLGNMLVSL